MLDGVGSGDGPDGNAYTLQSVTPQELNGDVIVCTISIDDSNAIKQIRDLATMRETTFLDIAEGTFDDMVDIGVNPSSHKATAFTRDWTPPVLLEFTLDMTTHKLVLTFDETVDPATLIYSRFAFVNGAKAVKLTNGETNSVAGTEVTITLDIDDVDALKLEPGVATKDSDTFLRLWQGAIKDADGNSIAAITEHAVKSGGYQRDGTPPALVAVAVNINEASNEGTLTLNFDEPVGSASLEPSAITLLARNAYDTAEPGEIVPKFTLTDGSTVSDNGRQIVVKIILEDLNKIKENEGLFTSAETAWVMVTALAMTDMATNPVAAIDAPSAVQATTFVKDTTSPELLTFDLNMHTATLTLHFEETVDASSLDLSALTLQKTSHAEVGSDSSHTLTGGDRTNTDGTEVVITLLRFDLDELTRKGIGSRVSNSYLTATEGAIRDMNGQLMVPLITNANAKRVDVHTQDSKSPELDGFELDMNAGTVTLSFSETIDAGEIDVSQLTFHGLGDGSSDGLYALTKESSEVTSLNGEVATIQIGLVDLNELKRQSNLVIDDASTFVSYSDTFAQDMVENLIVPRGAASALSVKVDKYTKDGTDPKLLDFDFDMSGLPAVLTLYFDETVRAATVKPELLTLQSEEGDAPSTEFKLTGAFFKSTADGTEVSISLKHGDLNALKIDLDLANKQSTTMLTFPAELIDDMSGNSVQEQLGDNAIEVLEYYPDVTAPKLDSFSLNLTSETLTLSFSETVSAASLMPNLLTLQNDACVGAGSASVQLTGGSVESTDGPVVVLSLVDADLNQIKWNVGLATSLVNTFIVLGVSAIKDTALLPNHIDETQTCEAIQLLNSALYDDFTPPSLVKFTLDLNTHYLDLVFSEAVEKSMLEESDILIKLKSSEGSGGTQHMVQEAILVDYVLTDVMFIRLELSRNDMLLLQANTELAVSKETTFY
jgi:hypothetical protein